MSLNIEVIRELRVFQLLVGLYYISVLRELETSKIVCEPVSQLIERDGWR